MRHLVDYYIVRSVLRDPESGVRLSAAGFGFRTHPPTVFVQSESRKPNAGFRLPKGCEYLRNSRFSYRSR